VQALKKSINGIINKINAANIKNMLAEVFREVWMLQLSLKGQGWACRGAAHATAGACMGSSAPWQWFSTCCAAPRRT
jgi:hypothetical protein